MFLGDIILILGLKIIISQNPSIDCGYKQTVYGCYKESEKTIVTGYINTDQIAYHELGHALFLHDKQVKDVIKKYPQPNPYDRKLYDTDDKILNESVADYLVMYRYEPYSLIEFYPEIYNLFYKYLKEISKLNLKIK